MADISYQCPQCGRERKLSQYADPRGVVCPKCNVPFEAAHAGESGGSTPAVGGALPERPALRMKQRQADAPAEAAADQPEATAPPLPHPDIETPVGRPEVHEKKKKVSEAWLAGALFLLLGGLMYGLRYQGWLPPDAARNLRDYGWLAVLAGHAIIVAKAMTDNMLQGILSLLIPGYSLYYLFVVADHFYLRAVFAGLLIGIGQDAMVELNFRAQQLIAVVHAFIEAGGGDIR